MEQDATPAQVVLLIPALNPDRRLLELLDSLAGKWTGPVLLVDDGSDPRCRDIFDQAQADGCTVIRHARNLGKGRALKTGFNHCLAHWPDAIGAVTADADGQHTPQDILACAQALRQEPQALVLGCRDFAAADVPARSQFGNVVTRNVMRFLCGVRVTDTQTGLRAISSAFMSHMLDIYGERFEYETNMLLETRAQGVPIREVLIQTVYLESNRSSHFHPVRDSWRIYSLLLRFWARPLAAFAADIALFALLLHFLPGDLLGLWLVGVSTLLARLLPAAFFYPLFRRTVPRGRPLWRYLLIMGAKTLLSAGAVTLCALWLPLSPVLWKAAVDLILRCWVVSVSPL